MIRIRHLRRKGDYFEQGKAMIESCHYLHSMPDPRTSFEMFGILVDEQPAGYLVYGRPQATRCKDWYGGVEDVERGKCEVTRWQVLNLARVWIRPEYQSGGALCKPGIIPGFVDRNGEWRPALASDAIRLSMESIGYEYLCWRPPVFLDEPYEIRWLMSYCNTRLHRGVIYRAAGFELYSTNEDGVQTWRKRLENLTGEQHRLIRERSSRDRRANAFRSRRAQMRFEI